MFRLVGSAAALLFITGGFGADTECMESCLPSGGNTDCCDYVTMDNGGYASYCETYELDYYNLYWVNCDTETDTDSSKNDTNFTAFDCSLNWDVDFVGKSGQFKLFPCDDSNFFIKIKFEGIYEYDENGDKVQDHKMTTFAYAAATEDSDYSSTDSPVYTWRNDDGNDVTLGGVTLYYYTRIGDNLVTVLLTLYLIDDITIIEWTQNNITYYQELSQGTLKFDYTIKNWPFDEDSSDHSLGLEVKMTTGGTTNKGSSDGSSDGKSRFSWGDDFVVDMPETYEHTNAENVTTGKDCEVTMETTGSGKQATIEFLFKDAGDAYSINYDPWTYIFESKNSEDAAIINYNCNAVFAVVACVIAAISLY